MDVVGVVSHDIGETSTALAIVYMGSMWHGAKKQAGFSVRAAYFLTVLLSADHRAIFCG